MTARASYLIVDLPRLAIGERVQHELLVCDRLEKATGSGEPYLVLTLGNAAGRLETAPIWSDKLQWADGAERGSVVQAIGRISSYGKNGISRRQLELTAPLRVLPRDQFDPNDFLPTIPDDRTKIWDWIDRVRAEMASATLRRMVDLFFADDEFRVRFERAPASTGGHHAKIGGLLLHVYEVTSIARHTARTMRANVDLVTAGALLHDIGKVEAYAISPAGFTFTTAGQLCGHVVLGSIMLERAVARLAEAPCTPAQLLELQHFILSHHGALEFGSPVVPSTAEAEIVHWADESSAKTNDLLESLADDDYFATGGEISDRRIWRVNRRLWRRPHDWP